MRESKLACKFIHVADQEAQSLKKEIEARMDKAHKVKAAKWKAFLRFKCPYTDITKGTPCPQSHFSFKCEGAQAHLANCLHFYADVFVEYIKEKGIEIDT